MANFITKAFGAVGAKVLAGLANVGKNVANLTGFARSGEGLVTDLGDAIGRNLTRIGTAINRVGDYFSSPKEILSQVPFDDIIGDELAIKLPIRKDARGLEPIHSYQVDIVIQWNKEGITRKFNKFVHSTTPMDRADILDAAERSLWDSFRTASKPPSQGGEADISIVSMIIYKYRIYGD